MFLHYLEQREKLNFEKEKQRSLKEAAAEIARPGQKCRQRGKRCNVSELREIMFIESNSR